MAEQGQTRAEKLQPAIITRFQKILSNNELAHAYLFVGPGGSGKMSIAQWLSLRLFCLHPHDNEPDLTCAEFYLETILTLSMLLQKVAK